MRFEDPPRDFRVNESRRGVTFDVTRSHCTRVEIELMPSRSEDDGGGAHSVIWRAGVGEDMNEAGRRVLAAHAAD